MYCEEEEKLRRRALPRGITALVAVLFLWLCRPARLQAQPAFDVVEGYQTVSLNLLPKAKFSVPAAVALTPPSTFLADFTGSLMLAYRVRTTPNGGGTLTVQGGSDFLNTTDPASTIPISSLRFTCSAAMYGAACAGSQNMSLISQSPVLSAPGSACMGGPPPCHSSDQAQMSILFALRDDPAYSTGSYGSQLLFTFSAL
jgi:hypothetical protein